MPEAEERSTRSRRGRPTSGRAPRPSTTAARTAASPPAPRGRAAGRRPPRPKHRTLRATAAHASSELRDDRGALEVQHEHGRLRPRELEELAQLGLLEVEIARVEDALDERVGARLERRDAPHDRDVLVARQRQHAVVLEQDRGAPLRALARPRRNFGWPQMRAAASGSTYGSSNRPSRNLSRSSGAPTRRCAPPRCAPTARASTTTSGQASPPNWSTAGLDDLRDALRGGELLDAPALRGPHRSAGIGESVTSPQSVQTTPSKP